MAYSTLAQAGVHLAPSTAETAMAAAYPTTYKLTVPATGATAGTPGAWTPAASAPAPDVAALIAGKPGVVTASPATAWTTGQYVQTQAPGVAGRAYWSGTAWVAGAKP